MDEGRPCIGMDKYQNHTRDSLLWVDYPDGDGDAAVWMGCDATSSSARCSNLPRGAATAPTIAHDEAVLRLRRKYGRIPVGAMGLHEGAKEILAPSDYRDARLAGKFDCFDPGFRCRAVHLHVVLNSIQ